MVSEPAPIARPKVRWGRRIAWGAAIATPLSVLALWIAVNRVEWLGPVVADTLRAVIGKEAVTELEHIGYGIQDRVLRYVRRNEQPKAHWQVPPPAATVAAPVPPPSQAVDAGKPPRPPFRPSDVGPVHKSWSAPGDGLWVPIAIPDLPDLPPHLFKTLLHPDKNRSWAELFVVAMSVHDVDVHLVAGTQEPEATVEAAKTALRPGVIPEELHGIVLGAFNGGFKTEHGRYGMRVGDVTLVEPRLEVCAAAAFKDGTMAVASWERLAAREPEMIWWRQAPNCMYEDNKLHPKLEGGNAKNWGATLDGETVIRRSAIGISAAGDTLFIGISNHTTANAIALGMNHAGAVTVAQLDVNFSYPKFVLFESAQAGGKRQAVALAEGFEFSLDEFIRKSSPRDFFYITPRSLRR